jgi:hypothetical protein
MRLKKHSSADAVQSYLQAQKNKPYTYLAGTPSAARTMLSNMQATQTTWVKTKIVAHAF